MPKKTTKKKRRTAKSAKRAKKRRRKASPARNPQGRFAATASNRDRQDTQDAGRPAVSDPAHPVHPCKAPPRTQLLVKLVSGQRLAPREVHLVVEFLAPILAHSPQKLVEDLTGSPRKMLLEWERQGAPRNADDTYPLARLLTWLKDKWKAQQTKQLPLEIDWQARLKKAKALTEEDGYALSHGRLVERDLVDRLFDEMADVYILSNKRLPDLATLLAGASATRARQILAAYRDRARTEVTALAARCAESLGETAARRESEQETAS